MAMGVGACSTAAPEPPATASLTVIVSTDMGIPRDLDTLDLRAEGDGKVLLQSRIALGTSKGGLPLAFVVRSDAAKGTRLRVVATGLAKGLPVVLQEATTTLPRPSGQRLHLKLSFLCRGSKSVVPSTGAAACGNGQTCSGGRCVSTDKNSVSTGSSSENGESLVLAPSACFDTLGCFSGTAAVPVRLQGDDCILQGPAPLDPEARTVALVPAEGWAGACEDSGRCYVPLDRGEGESDLRIVDQRWLLPKGACEPGIAAVLVSRPCPRKEALVPLCGPGTESAPTSSSPRDAPASNPPPPISAPGPSDGGAEPTPDAAPVDTRDGGSEPSSILQLTATDRTTCVVLRNHTVRCWGDNGEGHLEGSTREVSLPGLSRVTQLALGERHACALLDDSTVRCWGSNAMGATGWDPLVQPKGSLTDALPGLSGVAKIVAGTSNTCALMKDGTLRCWGSNEGKLTEGSSPTEPIPGLSGIVDVSLAESHACAVFSSGTVRCWGNNSSGQCGWSTDDVAYDDGTKHEDIPGLSGAVSVVTGSDFSCVTRLFGTVRCWGNSGVGQTGWTEDDGDGNGRVDRDLPGLSGVEALSAGFSSVCARMGGGAVRCWGDTNEWMAIRASSVRENILGLTGVSQVAVGAQHVCGALKDGSLECWGYNDGGQLGAFAVVSDLPGLSGVVQATAGNLMTCVTLADGTVRCWGNDKYGQLGGTTPERSLGGLSGVVQVATGDMTTCARLATGKVRCWGYSSPLNGLTFDPYIDIEGLEGTTQLSLGRGPGWAIVQGGALRCWDCSEYGGVGSKGRPYTVPGIQGVAELGVGPFHVCARNDDGSIRCWGRDDRGQTQGGTLAYPLPGLSGITRLAVGGEHTCVLLAEGTVRCWGYNAYGQTAGGSFERSIDGLSGVVDIAAGQNHTCAVLRTGSVRCWGLNGSGQTLGSAPQRDVPGLTNARSITAGLAHTCAILSDRTLRCWGDDTFGEVSGNPQLISRLRFRF